MKLTLIKPNMGRQEHAPYLDEGRMEPLELGVLAALTPPEWEVALVDDRCEPVPFDAPTDAVAITSKTFTAKRAYEIAAAYRRRGVPVVLGGFHPTLLPEEAAEHADAVVLGDAEGVWAEVLEDARRGRLRPRYQAPPGPPQAQIVPRRDLFAGKGYLPLTLAQFGRGCPNQCEFCAVSAFFGATHRHRPPAEVAEEVRRQGRRLVFFVDDNIVADRDAAKELFRALIPLKVRWVSQASIDMVHDRELMELMVRSGCLGNVIGFESIEADDLRAMDKAPNLAGFAGYEAEIETLKRFGLQTWASFTVGHDHDTVDGLYRLLDFALRHRFTFAAFNVLMPYPRTPYYERLRAEGRLLYGGRWWVHPDYRINHAAFVPARMTPEELTRVAFDLRRRWNSPGALVRRFLDLRTNLRGLSRMALYWAYNPLFRRETFKKQGMRFGLS